MTSTCVKNGCGNIDGMTGASKANIVRAPAFCIGFTCRTVFQAGSTVNRS